MWRMDSANLYAEMRHQMHARIDNDPTLNNKEKAAAKIRNGGVEISGKCLYVVAKEMKSLWITCYRPCFQTQACSGWEMSRFSSFT